MKVMSVKMRQMVERKIVRRFVRDALAAGFRLAVSLERGFDLAVMTLGARNEKDIMREAFAGDECHIFIQPEDGPVVEDDSVVSIGWVHCVFGNDGWDVICDYAGAAESLLVEAFKVSDYYSQTQK